MWGKLIGAAAVIAATALSAGAQQRPGGKNLTFGMDQRVESGRNLDLAPGRRERTSSAAVTLSATVSTVTRRASLALSADTTVRAEESSAVNDGGLALRYGLRGARTQLAAQASLRRREMAFLEPLSLVDLDDGVLAVPEDLTEISGEGLRTDSRFALSGQFRRGLPAQIGLTLSGTRIAYQQVTQSDLMDSLSLSGSLRERFQLAPDMVLALRQGVTFQQEDGSDALLGRSFEATLTRRQRARRYSLSMETVWPESSPARLSLTGGVMHTLGQEQRYALTLGVTASEGGGRRVITTLDYSRRLSRRDRIAISLDRRVRDEADGDVVLVSAGRGRYAIEVNRQTSFGFAATYVATENLTQDRSTRDYAMHLSLERALSRDWVLGAGLSRSLRSASDTGSDAVSDKLFVRLGRDWSLRF